ncbi:MAG: protein kinase [Myxococcaceae bacterium]|nr:protein kinase [Myxococcaceae bacterium]
MGVDTPDIAQRVSSLMRTLGSSAETVVRNPRSTVEPPREVRSGRRALEVLQGLSHDHRALVEEAVLGEGGMGVVKLARQVALDRQVAVKTLRGATSHQDVEALLSEAWLAGSLEHPGILPIYALSLGPDGLPAVVMKRIEGVTWSRLLSGQAELSTYAPGATPLESHLRVAMQVCNALHFAHSRGVVHRDLKPDNVMLGRFGEVYLVDWGIATAPGPTTQFAGTPAYMAPEMIGGDGATLSARTDVYLLGAILHEVVTGAPPHLRDTPQQMFESVVRSAPQLPDDSPRELADLIRRCMARDPSSRPGSALEVRHALESFLEHQGSRELEQQSRARGQELAALIADPSPDPVRVARLHSECRFGFQQALRIWPENPAAREGLTRLTEQMVAFELTQGAVRAARTLLAELPAPPAELTGAVRRAEEAELAKAKELARLQSLEEAADPLTGSRTRMLIAIGLGLIWATSPLIGGWFHRTYPDGDETLGVLPVGVVSLAALIAAISRTRAVRTPLNVQIGHLLLYALTVQLGGIVYLWFVLGGLGASTMSVLLGYWAIIAGAFAAALVREVWPTAAAFLGAAVAAVQWPAWRYEFTFVANAALLVNMVVILTLQTRALRAREAKGEPVGPRQ